MIAPDAGLGAPGFDSRRLWSLWDIMEKFRVALLCEIVEQITLVVSGIGKEDDKNQYIPETLEAQINRIYQRAVFAAKNWSLKETLKLLLRLTELHRNHDVTYTRAGYELENLLDLLSSELKDRAILILEPGEGRYYERDNLFGPEVFEAFPSARDDIKEAGSCLACGRATAAVFHLMRAAEIGLRILAWDRRVKFDKQPNKPLEYRQWEDMLAALERKERDIEQFPVSAARDAQFAFYHGAMVELRAFKNLYRNRTAHARDIYDMHQARSAMQHVTAFMKILAGKITEKKRTPERWRRP